MSEQDTTVEEQPPTRKEAIVVLDPTSVKNRSQYAIKINGVVFHRFRTTTPENALAYAKNYFTGWPAIVDVSLDENIPIAE